MRKRKMKNMFRTAVIIFTMTTIGICLGTIHAQAQPCSFCTTPETYGAVGDGVHDDTAAVNAALASLTSGGTVLLTGKYLIASANVIIPPNVTLEGTYEQTGATTPSEYPGSFAALNSAIILNSNYTISLGGGSTIQGLLIRREGQVFPAPDATGFAGTAITAAGDDHSITGCMIIGFNKAIYSSGYGRQYYNHILGDNLNFIEVTGSYDIGRIIDCHAWPFIAYAYTGPGANPDRQVGYNIHDGADWFKITNCFAYGYTTGINLTNVNSVTLLGCGVDGTEGNTSSIGINIVGQAGDVRLDSCQVAAQAQAIYINTGYTDAYRIVTQIVDCDLWGNVANGTNSKNIFIQDGDAEILGCHIRNGNTGVYVNNPVSRVLIEGNGFDDIGSYPIYNAAGSPYVLIGLNDYGIFPTGAGVVYNMAFQTAALGSGLLFNTLLLPPSGDVFSIPSGTKNFSFIHGSSDGRIKTLLFNGALTITSSTLPNGIRLSNASSYISAPGTTLSVMLTPAGYWVETGRSNK